MFPYTYPSEKKRIQVRLFQDILKQFSVERWGAGSNDHMIEAMLLDALFDHVLAGFGTDKGIVRRNDNIREQLEVLTHLIHINGVLDVVTAMTDKDTGLH